MKANSGGDHPAEHDSEVLRREALKARRKLKDARKLANKVLPESELSCEQIELLIEFNSGLLEKTVLENNKAYGHGEGVKITSKAEAACFRMSCNTLNAYFDH